MKNTQLIKLKNDLLKFQINSIASGSNDGVEAATQIVIKAIDKQIEESAVAKPNDIVTIISLLDSGDTAEIEASFPKINYIELEKLVNSKIEIESLDNYTILQLKVIYYLLTHDKENNAIKTNKKESVQNSVKEVIFSNMRTQKLKNL